MATVFITPRGLIQETQNVAFILPSGVVKETQSAGGPTTHTMTPVSKALTLTRNQATLTVTRAMAPSSKALTLTRNTATLSRTYTLNGVAKTLTLTRNTATLTVIRRMEPLSKALTLTRNTATLTVVLAGIVHSLNAVSKALTFTPQQATLTVTRRMSPVSKALSLAKNQATLAVTRQMNPLSKALTFTKGTASLTVTRRLNAVSKALSLTRNTATLTWVRGSVTTYTMTPISKALTLARSQAVLTVRRAMTPVSKALTFTPHVAVFTLKYYDHETEVCKEVFDMATVVGICNKALGMAGAGNLISSLAEQSAEAMACNSQYDDTRLEITQAVSWAFCRRQKRLALLGAEVGTDENPNGDSEISEYGWRYTYAYPNDCLEPLLIIPSSEGVLSSQFTNTGDMRDGQNTIVPFVESTWCNESGAGSRRIISTNKQSAILVYQANITDPSVFPPDFVALLTVTLAGKLATHLGNERIAIRLIDQASKMMAQLRQRHSLEYNTDRKPIVYDPTPDYLKGR